MNHEIEFKASKFRKIISFIVGVLLLFFAASDVSAELAASFSQGLYVNPVFALILLRTVIYLLGILILYSVFMPYSVYISPQYIRTTLVKPVLWQQIERIEKMTADRYSVQETTAKAYNKMRILTFYLKPGYFAEIKVLGLFPIQATKIQIIGKNLQNPDKLEEEIKKYFPGGIS